MALPTPPTTALAVAPEALSAPGDPTHFSFTTTAELAPLDGLVGQPRALASLDLGLEIMASGYNLYVAGPAGTGKTTMTLQRVTTQAARQPVPSDWCYVANFADPYSPQAISLPAGQGTRFATAMRELVTACQRALPRAFEDDRYAQRRQVIQEAIEAEQRRLSAALEAAATERHFRLESSPMGLFAIPLVDGQPLEREQFTQLPRERQVAIEAASDEMTERIQHFLLATRRLAKQASEQFQALDVEVARYVITPLVDDVREDFTQHPRLLTYLDQVAADLVEQRALFAETDRRPRGPEGVLLGDGDAALARYEVNVVVDHRALSGAPVVVEHHPTYYNLCGRIDYTARLGGMVTDHRLIKAGALQRASGGFLIIAVRDLLAAPFAWEALKRALRSGQVVPENLGDQYSPIPTATLKPEPIPVQPKVILIGDRATYQLLAALDDDVHKLIKVRADFDERMPRTAQAELTYAAFLADQTRQGVILPFEPAAVARLVEHGARLAGHQRQLSTSFSAVLNVAIEASHWSRQAGGATVTAAAVERALEQHLYRANLVEERVQQLFADGTLRIDVTGAAIGQINGLSVLDDGDYAFGHPSRITARVAPGGDGVINIERETKQSGPSHSKGVLTLSGYLLGQYGADGPLALSASLGFEQLYSGVDGDSASAAELLALLSALAELPLRQELAVTGSVDQWGELQAIGGVNEKIEGFFALCAARGLTGQPGVVIPRANLPHLMLRAPVIAAVRAGTFQVYAAARLDEVAALLTGRPAGARAADGQFPADSLHGRVAARLARFRDQLAATRPLTVADGQHPGIRTAITPDGAGAAGTL